MNSIIRKIGILVLATCAFSAAASAQSWVQVATAIYPGGNARVNIPFGLEVETTQIALVVPQYCAPRALSSRAQVVDQFGGGWMRTVDLRFVRQDYFGGNIRAFYYVYDQRGGQVPLVSGLTFGFAQVSAGPLRSCPLTVHALPGSL